MAGALTEAFCGRLRAHRRAQGVSIYRLSKLTGLSERAIGFVEKGERTPTIDTVARISLALGLTVSDLAMQAEESVAERPKR